jgi:hypothetical protein
MNEATVKRVLEKIDLGDGCWEWNAHRGTTGYGEVGIDGHKLNAHRVVYEILVSPIPEGLTIDHLCRNRACVRPDHLEPVDERTNILRGEGMGARYARRDACDSGHAYDLLNTYFRPDGARVCKSCRREIDRKRRPPKGV